jgi:ABC-type sulfate transport system permease component
MSAICLLVLTSIILSTPFCIASLNGGTWNSCGHILGRSAISMTPKLSLQAVQCTLGIAMLKSSLLVYVLVKGTLKQYPL